MAAIDQICSSYEKSIIFVNTKKACKEVMFFLRRKGHNVDFLNSDLSPKIRKIVIGKFRTNGIKHLIATDLAARGLDFPNLPLIVNYDYPRDKTIYTHRIGRTGRNGCKGIAISFTNHAKLSKRPAQNKQRYRPFFKSKSKSK